MVYLQMYNCDHHFLQFNGCYSFDTAEERDAWSLRVKTIRKQYTYFWGDGPRGEGGIHPTDTMAYTEWLALVFLLKDEFATDKVPPDIKWMTSPVEAVLNERIIGSTFRGYTKEVRDLEIQRLERDLERFQADGSAASAAPMPHVSIDSDTDEDE